MLRVSCLIKLVICFDVKDENSLKAKKKENDKIQKTFEQLEEQHKTDEEGLHAAQKHFHAISAGLSSNTDGEAASLNDQLMSKVHLLLLS